MPRVQTPKLDYSPLDAVIHPADAKSSTDMQEVQARMPIPLACDAFTFFDGDELIGWDVGQALLEAAGPIDFECGD